VLEPALARSVQWPASLDGAQGVEIVQLYDTEAFGLYEHTFAFLRSALGAPARTFSYSASSAPDIRDHVWRCGCGAREKADLCELVPCGKHVLLNRRPPPRARAETITTATRGSDEAVRRLPE
jgi:hypothetical protein